ncbi:MAG: disulfide bond formation protein B [Herminiimonas sp.]|jgi:disulfide bond formation protein DsbB|uniref:disulfide bond formation protein B n=1 Tax=Herminiimonas sp. TaxID=1926289 RepID=UPI0027217152|nr:disulfide bond formation protein B [Herminiimonas sp.]MDO9419048.1 disulfide bond formation protein B [Herminiimonas sp.]
MKKAKPVLLAVAFVSLALLAFALYLQHVENMQPCPLCVIQRYAFAAIAIICLISAFRKEATAKVGAALASLASLAGAGVAGWHIYIKANPTVSCGIDPLETSLNTIPTAKLLPFLFQADGLCTTAYAPILGLSLPQWSLVWFVVIAIFLLRTAFQKKSGYASF